MFIDERIKIIDEIKKPPEINRSGPTKSQNEKFYFFSLSFIISVVLDPCNAAKTKDTH